MSETRTPHVVVLGGPNGAGKSTVAPHLLRDVLGVRTFVNADDIARGLSGFAPETVAMRAGRVMLDRLTALTRARETFAFESTLSGLGMAGVLRRCRAAGYRVHVLYLWLPSAELALSRVQRRVAAGGHDVPEADVRRRWGRSLVNFLDVYRRLATHWRLYDGSTPPPSVLVARGREGTNVIVRSPTVWDRVVQQACALGWSPPAAGHPPEETP